MLVSQKFLRLAPLALVFALVPALPSFAADNITGVVINKTTNKPAAGDEVALIRLQGMQEATRTTTDAKGHFSLVVLDEGPHLVRVMHDKVYFFGSAGQGTQSVAIEVFDVAPKVKGIVGEADVMKIQTDAGGKKLNIVENFFVKNDSAPPMTQYSDKPFEFILPDGVTIEGAVVLAPGGVPVAIEPVPLPEKGHYIFLYPINPGETRFQVTSSVPYNGSFTFAPHPSLTMDNFVAELPKSMTFKAGPDARYSLDPGQVSTQAFVARNVSPSQAVGFTVSGTGQLPLDMQDTGQGSKDGEPQAPAPVPEDLRGSFLYGSCRETIRYTEASEDKRTLALAAEANMCTRYIAGFIDALAYFPKPHAVCADNVRVGSVVRTYVSYMQNHPEKMNTHASVGLMETLLESYHCSVQK